MNSKIAFNGDIPNHYQDLLTPFLFDPFSADLIKRIDFATSRDILELASGTGSLTRLLAAHLEPGSHLAATDLQESMLEVAKQSLNSEDIDWGIVDMTNIPYENESYDLIVCQFGLMLVPDTLKALSEMHRVLKPGGKLLFSVWADIQNNAVWDISGNVIAGFIGQNPMLQKPGPFSLSDENETLGCLQHAGFMTVKTKLVEMTGEAPTAAVAAQGFVEGLPVFMAINNKDPQLISEIQSVLGMRLMEHLGNLPMRSPLSAWTFEAIRQQ